MLTFDYRDPVWFQIACVVMLLPWAAAVYLLERVTPDA